MPCVDCGRRCKVRMIWFAKISNASLSFDHYSETSMDWPIPIHVRQSLLWAIVDYVHGFWDSECPIVDCRTWDWGNPFEDRLLIGRANPVPQALQWIAVHWLEGFVNPNSFRCNLYLCCQVCKYDPTHTKDWFESVHYPWARWARMCQHTPKTDLRISICAPGASVEMDVGETTH